MHHHFFRLRERAMFTQDDRARIFFQFRLDMTAPAQNICLCNQRRNNNNNKAERNDEGKKR